MRLLEFFEHVFNYDTTTTLLILFSFMMHTEYYRFLSAAIQILQQMTLLGSLEIAPEGGNH